MESMTCAAKPNTARWFDTGRDVTDIREVKSAYLIQGLGLSYGSRTALRDVTMTIPRGRITTLIGPSGCGKSSLLLCLARLTQHYADTRVSGKVMLDDIDLYSPRLDLKALRRRIGLVFQKPAPFPLSIRKNIEIVLRDHGVGDKHALAEAVEKSLRDVHLWEEVKDRLDALALSLSGGQQQRLCIARSMALQPEIVLMDEPCSALDPISSGAVEDLIVELGRRYTVVMVTHNLAQARRTADEVAFFWLCGGAGRLVEHGAAEQIFLDPRDALTAAYVSGAKG